MIFNDFNNLSIGKLRKKMPADTCQEMHYSEAQCHPLDITDFQVMFDNFLFFLSTLHIQVYFTKPSDIFLKMISYLLVKYICVSYFISLSFISFFLHKSTKDNFTPPFLLFLLQHFFIK